MIPASQRHAASLAQLDNPAEHQVAVLSAALLQAVMNTYGEDQHGFAARAGVAAEVVADAMTGTRPAWALPYEQFAALVGAVASLWPCAVFETAAACDLLLSCVLNGDLFITADVLTDPRSQGLARALLTMAVSSAPASGTGRARDALLPGHVLAALTGRAAALARSGSADAWVGVEILLICLGRQS